MSLKKIGASIILEGEKEYRNALKNINSDQKELKSEMQLSAAEYKNTQNSLEALESKYDILGRQVEKQKEKVGVYNSALEEASKIQSDAGSSVEKYSEELKQAEAELEKMRGSSDTTNEALEEQEKKVGDLQQKLDESNTAYEKATQNVSYWQTGLNNAQATLVGMERDLQETGKYLEEANNSTDKCAKSIDEFGKNTKEAEESILTFGDVAKANLASDLVMAGLETMTSLIKDAGEGLIELATNAAYYADNINTMSTVTGVATDTIQALYYSEELLDVSVSTVTSSMAKNVRAMQNAADGSEKYVDAYDALGISVLDANDELRDSEEIFWECVDALGKMDNATQRDAIAMQIFGRSAQQLNPLIKAGSNGFSLMKEEATQLGYVLDQQTLNALNETSDGLERLSKYGDTLKQKIGAEMSDEVNAALDSIREAIENNEDAIMDVVSDAIPKLANGLVTVVENIDKIIPLVSGLAAGFVTFKTASVAVGLANTAMALYTSITEGATIAQLALNAAASANPFVLLATAVVGVGVALGTMAAQAEKSSDKMDEIFAKYDEQIEKSKKSIESREENRKSIEAEGKTIDTLRNSLLQLNEKQTLSNEERLKMKSIVQELNTIMPELNLQLDEETGHLKDSSDAVEAQIENRKQLLYLEAAEEDMAQIINDKYEAEKTLYEIEQQRSSHMADMAVLQEAINEATKEGTEYAGELIDVYGDGSLVGDVATLTVAYGGFNDTLDGLNQRVSEQESIISSLDEEYAVATGFVDKYSDSASKAADEISNLQEAHVVWKGVIVTAVGESAIALENLEQAYYNAKVEAKKSIDEQVSLFGELSNKSDLTVQQMKENLDSQTEVMNTYADDMEKARKLVESGLMEEGLLGELQELGLSGAGYLHELVTAAEEDEASFAEVMESWSNQQEAVDNLASYMADMQTNYTETMDGIVGESRRMQNETNQSNERALENYEKFGKSILKWFGATQPKVEEESGLLGQSAIKGAKDALKMNSAGESEEGNGIGKGYADSIAAGIRSGQTEINSAIDDVTKAANEKAKKAVEDINRMLGGLI